MQLRKSYSDLTSNHLKKIGMQVKDAAFTRSDLKNHFFIKIKKALLLP